MLDAGHRTKTRSRRSRIDHLADRAPKPFRTAAGALALSADRLITAREKARTQAGWKLQEIRARPLPYVLGAVAVGAGLGLLAYGPSRRAIGGAVSRAGGSVFGAVGRQLSKEIRSLIR